MNAPFGALPVTPPVESSSAEPAPNVRSQSTEAPSANAPFGASPVTPPAESPSAEPAPVASSSSFGNAQGLSLPDAPPTEATAFSSGMVYERAPRSGTASGSTDPTEPTATLPAETPFGSDATNPSSKIGAVGPFKPLQQIPATLMTAIRTPGGGSVPVVAVTADGGSFVGVSTVNATLARVDMQFRRYVAADGNIYEIDALAYSRDPGGLTQGLPAEVQVVAPTLALDAAQNSANALNTYVQNVAAAARGGQNTSINIGDNLTLSGPSAATLAQTLLGGLGSTLRMPENTQSVTRVATVRGNMPMIVIAGLGGEGR